MSRPKFGVNSVNRVNQVKFTKFTDRDLGHLCQIYCKCGCFIIVYHILIHMCGQYLIVFDVKYC